MDFSESLQFGNSTYMKLESQAKRAIKENCEIRAPEDKPMADVILESPTASRNKSSVKNSTCRSVQNATQYGSSHQRTIHTTQRRKFARSKSDSIIVKTPTNVNEDICENYSEFFKSDFLMPVNSGNELQRSTKHNDGTSYLRVSQIEAALIDIDDNNKLISAKNNHPEQDEFFDNDFLFDSPHKMKRYNENGLNLDKTKKIAITPGENVIDDALCTDSDFVDEDFQEGSLDKPIFSEDLKDLIQTEDVNKSDQDMWQDTLRLSEIPDVTHDIGHEDPQMNKHDVSSFLYQSQERSNERNQTISKDLEISRKVFKEYEKPMFDVSVNVNENANLSSMSPNQLKLTQILPRSPSKTKDLKIQNLQSDVKIRQPVVATTLEQRQLSYSPDNIENLNSMSSWCLPHSILKEYERKGVKKMFDWQVQCLKNPKVIFEHCNLVYSAPTSAGKTLVSEILLLKTVLERRKKVLLILPFISVVREKMLYLQDLLTAAGYRVEGFFGGYTPPGGFESINVAICTIEKANSIVNKLLEKGKLEDIGTVIVDEVHLISDPGRGYILELLLAKVLYMSRKYAMQIQVIAMSATLANIGLLKNWLDAELFVTNFRPVELHEMIKIGNHIYDSNLKVLRAASDSHLYMKEPFPVLENDSEHVAQLCLETIVEGCSVLVFCSSKDWCENLAVQLAGAIHAVGKQGGEWGQRLRAQLNRQAIDELKNQLKHIPTGLDAVLEKTITYGCAYHHAGLTTEERDIVEANFKSGALKIIVATSTLSSGVNLPARRVLIRSPLFGGKKMSSLTYRQMIGRAGRTGKDTLGESILICTESNSRVGKELVTANLKPISSCLDIDSSTHLKRALLEVISSGVATSKEDIDNFVNCTLLSAERQMVDEVDVSGDHEQEVDCISALDFLVEYEFVRLQKNEAANEENYVATRLGMACLASSMPPTDGLILFAELQKSRRCFVLESELHAVYLVTPYSVCYQLQEIDWLFFLDVWEKLTPAMRKVGELVGVKESFLVRAMRGQTKLDYKLLQIHKRFYTALALQELVNETPINAVAKKYKCPRGMLQSLQQMASTFAGIVTSFCSSLQWDTLALIVSQFKERLYFGIHRDLIDLMRLPDLNHKRARVLFDAGITSLVELANSDVASVDKILFNACSFDSAKQHDNENAAEAAQRNEARNVYITGKAGITVREAAKLIIQEARLFVQHDIGVGNINWSLSYKESDNGDNVAKDENETHMSFEENKFNNGGKIQESGPPLNSKDLNSLETKKTDNNEKISIENQLLVQNNICENNINALREHKNKNSPLKNAEAFNKNNLEELQQHFVNNDIEAISKLGASSNLDRAKVIKQQQNFKDQKTENYIEKHQHENPEPLKKMSVSDDDSKGLNALKLTEGCLKNNLNPHKDTVTNKIKSPVKRKSSEELRTPPKISKANSNMLTPKHDNDDKPSTSKKAQRLLRARQQSEMKKQEWIKRKEEVESTNRYAGEGRLDADHKRCNLNNESQTPLSENNTKIRNANTLTKLPRRSPRNLISSTRIEYAKTPPSAREAVQNMKQSVKSPPNLFDNDNDENFGADTRKPLKSTCKVNPARNVLNQSKEDEIPSSQNFLQDVTVNKANSAQASKFLRSIRATQRLQSPRVPKATQLVKDDRQEKELKPTTDKDLEPATTHLLMEPVTLATSIELSNLSMENSLMKNPMHLNASHILSCSKVDTESSSFQSVDIIDICGNQQLFKDAFKELMANKRLGLSLGVQQQCSKRKPLIGSRLLLNQQNDAEKDSDSKDCYEFQIDNFQYLSGIAFCISENVVYYINMQSKDSCKGLTAEIKCKYLFLLLKSSQHTLLMYDAKDQLKVLRQVFKDLGDISASLEDPKVANWLLQPDKMHNLHSLALQFAPECSALVNLCGKSRGYSSYGLDSESAILAKVRCSIESCATIHILKGQIENLERIGTGQLNKFFKELEMPLQLSLCNMEVVGFPASSEALHKLLQRMVNTMKRLETKIYEIHGSRFNLGSSSAVAKVLGLHRKPNCRVSTSKQILEKIDTPISQMIVFYRKLNFTITNNIQPLLKNIKDERIHSSSITFTTTGRISMVEPNLQNVAKDFNVEIASENYLISCRSAFYPSDTKRCLIASDFCQLEMRILAHLSQDAALLEVMKSETDIFVAISARWNKIPEISVTEQLRNGTKQICYGLVYGMGMHALADGLKCTEQEAKLVTEQFHSAYPGIRTYTEKIIKFARNNGYIETITGRRRYLESINSEESLIKSQAERQAINSTIQGSAADIAKSAILRMEKNIVKYREKLGIHPQAVQLVLHLHDELIFEVPEEKAKKIAKVLSVTMENCVKLSIPLKVKLKTGRSWGELKELKL